MRDRRHALGQRREHRRGAAHGVAFQRFAAGEHQHDERAGQVLAQQHRRDDRNAGQQIGAELAGPELARASRRPAARRPAPAPTYSGTFADVARRGRREIAAPGARRWPPPPTVRSTRSCARRSSSREGLRHRHRTVADSGLIGRGIRYQESIAPRQLGFGDLAGTIGSTMCDGCSAS